MAKQEKEIPKTIQEMFDAGVHFGLIKSRRDPSTKAYIFGQKGNMEIFDLEKTSEVLEKALAFVTKLGSEKKNILFVSSKNESKPLVRSAAERLGMPFIAGRWIGGLLTNFPEIKKRSDRLADLSSKKEKGELTKYTKKERLLLSREMDNLEELFGGIKNLSRIPDALFVVDPRKESIAVLEAKRMKVPVIALASSDCNLKEVTFPIPGNDASRSSIEYILKRVTDAYLTAPVAAPAHTV
ncbi:MAG: 30S ribosomal protein S2 [bacterium]